MRISILGDTHGNTNFLSNAINNIDAFIGSDTILQLGDFGLWDHFAKGVYFLDQINAKLVERGMVLHAIGGNHENWDRWEWYVENNPKDSDGFAILRSNIHIAPRVHQWEWGGKRFVAVAGAASIDRGTRVANEPVPGRRTLWWPREQITDAELDVLEVTKPTCTHYLVTHDCSNRTPFNHFMVPDIDSQIHRQKIDRAIEILQPGMHLHGHMHHRYEWENWVGDRRVLTYGLECDGMIDSHGVLDTDTDTFNFEPIFTF